MHPVRKDALGIPQDSRFDLLAEVGKLDAPLADALKRMVGFRNIAVRDDQRLNLEVVQAIIEHHLVELRRFVEHVLRTTVVELVELISSSHRAWLRRTRGYARKRGVLTVSLTSGLAACSIVKC